MSSIPYNYGSYIDAKVSMTDTGHVSAGKQIQSPASAGSRGLAKTTQFTNDRTQMQMGNSPIAESMVEIRNILNRIDGVNAPVQEAESDYLYHNGKEIDQGSIVYDMQDYSDGIFELQSAKYADGTELDEKELEELESTQELIDWVMIDFVSESAVQEDIGEKGRIALEKAGFDPSKIKEYLDMFNDHGDTSDRHQMNMDKVGLADAMAMVLASHDVENESAVQEDAGEDEKVVDMLRNIKQHLDNHPNMNEHPSLVALDQLADDLESGDKPADYESADSGEMSRLKELSGIKEDVDMDALKMWNEKYSKYRGMNGDKLPFGLYMQMAQTGVPTDGMEAGEAKQAIADQNPKLDPNDAESLAGSAEEIPGVDFDKADAPITDAMKQELADIMGVDAIGEEEITKAMKILGVSTGMESYQPMPEGDEFDIEEDEDFEEVLGPLGFPEDETELFDAEYQGRKVPLNKPMRGDTKKFKVYVKDPKTGNVKKVNFGHGGTSAKRKTMRIRKSNPKARKSFRARHNCANPGPKTKARYWSCRKW
jgi:hypothetical protein